MHQQQQQQRSREGRGPGGGKGRWDYRAPALCTLHCTLRSAGRRRLCQHALGPSQRERRADEWARRVSRSSDEMWSVALVEMDMGHRSGASLPRQAGLG